MIAGVLAACWRASCAPAEASDAELRLVRGRLVHAGAASLAWLTLRDRGDLGEDSAAFRDAYRYQATQSRLAEEALSGVFGRLADAAIPALLGKGWAAARCYADTRARPVGDFDLYVDPSRADAAHEALRSLGAAVDLHAGCADLGEEPWPAIELRRVTRTCGGVDVACFGGADHLRLVALHMFRHGAWRPLWLCDVAAIVESGEVAWDEALKDARGASWTLAAVQLAVRLLGAVPGDDAPPPATAPPPSWLESAILESWGRDIVPHGLREPMSARLTNPLRIANGLVERWPNAIESAFEVGRVATDGPRRLDRIRAALRRTRRFAAARSTMSPRPDGAGTAQPDPTGRRARPSSG